MRKTLNFPGACGPQTPPKSPKTSLLAQKLLWKPKTTQPWCYSGLLDAAAQSRWGLFRDELAGLKAQFSKLKRVSVLSKNIRNIGAITQDLRIVEHTRGNTILKRKKRRRRKIWGNTPLMVRKRCLEQLPKPLISATPTGLISHYLLSQIRLFPQIPPLFPYFPKSSPKSAYFPNPS